jgi:hypothetical protein
MLNSGKKFRALCDKKNKYSNSCVETPENKKARLRYDNVFKTAWTDEVHFIKHSRKGNQFVFCEFCRTDFSINYGGHSDVTTVI